MTKKVERKPKLVSANELLFRLAAAAQDMISDYEAAKRSSAEGGYNMTTARWQSVDVVLQQLSDIQQWRRLTS